MLSGHCPVLKLYPGLQMFRPVQLVVLAVKGKTGFGSFGAVPNVCGAVRCSTKSLRCGAVAVLNIAVRLRCSKHAPRRPLVP